MSDIGKAYIQIIPSARGLEGAIKEQLNTQATKAGVSAGNLISKSLKRVLAISTIGEALVYTLNEGGKLQQALGGIETLFKTNAQQVISYANQAYKTVGLSASEYMEGVTSFSASLLASLGNDTKKAAEVANMAMIDMSDNSNKMGTSMEAIQNAYQGFAKQNYTMLDNLKLGYAGTKTEMQRLLADAKKITGIEYNINNLNDVYQAIHVIQKELKITGATAKEANTTLTGSFNAMKAAFKNVLGGLTLGENVSSAISELMATVKVFLVDNLFIMLGNIVKSIPEALGAIIKGLSSFILAEAPQIIINMCKAIADGIPRLMQEANNFINAFIQGIISDSGNVTDTMINLLDTLIQTLIDIVPVVLEKGLELIINLASGLLSGVPSLMQNTAKLLTGILEKIGEYLPQLWNKGIELIIKLSAGLIAAIPQLIKSIPKIIDAMLQEAEKFVSKFVDIGSNLIMGIKNGIIDAGKRVVDSIIGVCSNIFNSVKSFFGIHSPSKVFTDIGMYLNLGLAEGIDNNIKPVTKAITKLNESTLDSFESDLQYKVNTSTTGLYGSVGDTKANNNAVKTVNVSMNNITIKDSRDIKEIAEELGNLISKEVRFA